MTTLSRELIIIIILPSNLLGMDKLLSKNRSLPLYTSEKSKPILTVYNCIAAVIF